MIFSHYAFSSSEMNNPDDFNTKLPDAIMSARGSSWAGHDEEYSIVDVRVSSSDGQSIALMMEAEDARRWAECLKDAADWSDGLGQTSPGKPTVSRSLFDEAPQGLRAALMKEGWKVVDDEIDPWLAGPPSCGTVAAEAKQ